MGPVSTSSEPVALRDRRRVKIVVEVTRAMAEASEDGETDLRVTS
jgi:hypothetical protein